MKRSAFMSAAFMFLFSAVLFSTPDTALDLPVTKDKLPAPQAITGSLPPPPTITGTVPPPPPDDPRDEPGPVFFGEEIETDNDTLVYVIDTSSSMRHDDRMLKAKRECERSISALPPNIRFNVIGYSCSIRVLWSGVRPAVPANKSAARQFVGSLGADGATGTGPAVALGLADRSVDALVLLTDGAPNCGANGMDGHRAMIRNSNIQRASIHVFGIAASGSYRAFCQDVAADNGGSYTDVP